jgi:hypothetical protein
VAKAAPARFTHAGYQIRVTSGRRLVLSSKLTLVEHKSTAIGFPLYWHFANRQEDSSTSVLGPFYWAQRGSERTRGLLLAWYSRDEKNASALGIGDSS